MPIIHHRLSQCRLFDFLAWKKQSKAKERIWKQAEREYPTKTEPTSSTHLAIQVGSMTDVQPSSSVALLQLVVHVWRYLEPTTKTSKAKASRTNRIDQPQISPRQNLVHANTGAFRTRTIQMPQKNMHSLRTREWYR